MKTYLFIYSLYKELQKKHKFLKITFNHTVKQDFHKNSEYKSTSIISINFNHFKLSLPSYNIPNRTSRKFESKITIKF